ncbi:hypothetical protein [Mycobacteroides abscessus]|uniref:hypothetical protein n=1 Tax=Mycobacteroides abscessus TaxID=36809 RepID=UPI000C26A59A|nr:hypothetical protein [Mycobacteroides abscessus]
MTVAYDPVHRPLHYNNHPSGIECIEVTRLLCYDTGNATKYVWRPFFDTTVLQAREVDGIRGVQWLHRCFIDMKDVATYLRVRHVAMAGQLDSDTF